jgi:diguanylate cyclase (GGDEF)-like protein
MTAAPVPARRLPPALVAVLLTAALAVSAVLLLGPVDAYAVLVVDDLSQVLAAIFATVSTTRCAVRTRDGRRRAWTALAAGCGGWLLGQSIWSWYELVLHDTTPFPSVADIGFLGFPVGATAALLLYPAVDGRGDRSRRVLDGLTVTSALALVSWSSALGSVVREDSGGWLATTVSIAYPASDVVAISLVVLLLSRRTPDRLALCLVGWGITSIAVADSLFLWLLAVGKYTAEDHFVSLGWLLGFLLLGLAPFAVDTHGALREERSTEAAPASVLPYVPLTVAAAVVAYQLADGQSLDVVEIVLSGIALAGVLARQYATVRDNTRLLGELAEREAELRHQAFHDGLTGLANRALFRDRVAHALELHRRDLRPLTVLFCDLDDFKVINDTTGHAGGDALLVRVAERLRGALRSGDTLARLGGDEFAVLLEDGSAPLEVAQKLVESLRPPFVILGRSVQVKVSVGVTSVSADAPTPTADVLLAQADTAMYSAKRGGKDAMRSFETGMELAEVADSSLIEALTSAVQRGEVTLHYQPIVRLPSGEVTAVEALARWQHDGQPVPPSVFIPLAERTGLIGPLTTMLLEVAVRQAAQWVRLPGQSELRVGLNLSPSSIVDPDLHRRVADCLERHGLDGANLVFEVTESALLSDPAAAREVCRQLKTLGVWLALDDFGVGYSSLAHLHALPLDCLKVDRAFVDLVDLDEDQRRFTQAVLRLATDLGMSVVAEGVERPEQLAELQAMGCPYVQGYVLSRPVPAAQVPPLLDGSLLPALGGRLPTG